MTRAAWGLLFLVVACGTKPAVQPPTDTTVAAVGETLSTSEARAWENSHPLPSDSANEPVPTRIKSRALMAVSAPKDTMFFNVPGTMKSIGGQSATYVVFIKKGVPTGPCRAAMWPFHLSWNNPGEDKNQPTGLSAVSRLQ
jgi:hypothetical protein